MQASFKSNFLFAATTAVLTGLALFLIWEDRTGENQDRAIGEMLAETVARASIDGLIAQDAFEAGVVANRLTGVPRVAGVAIYTLENDLLAASGTLEGGIQFTQSVVLDETVLGFARISLKPPNPAPDWTRVGLSALALLAIPLVAAFWSYRLRVSKARPRTKPPVEPLRVLEATTHHILVGNMHNQFSLSRGERHRIAAQALAIAERVDRIYLSRSEHLPGTGLLMAFAVGTGADHAFQAVCAGFLMAKCLAAAAAPGEYRFGIHTLELDAGESLADHRDSVEDTALLAAVGRPGAIVASESFFAGLALPDRLDAQSFSHPMLKDLAASGDQCHQIAGLDQTHQALIESQAARLIADIE